MIVCYTIIYKVFLDAGLTVTKKRVERNKPAEELAENTGMDLDREIEAVNDSLYDCTEIVERKEPAEEIPDNMDVDREIEAGNEPAEDIPYIIDIDLDREINALFDSFEIAE